MKKIASASVLIVSTLCVCCYVGAKDATTRPWADNPASSPATATEPWGRVLWPASEPFGGEGKPFSGAKGKWRAYCPSALVFMTASPNYMWFAAPSASWAGGGGEFQATGQLGQINQVTGEARLFTMLDGLPLDQDIRVLDTFRDDRALMVMCESLAPFLWSPKDGWHSLPPVSDKGQIVSACFDMDGTILALWADKPGWRVPGTDLYEFVDGVWRLRRKVPPCLQVAAMKEGLVLRVEHQNISNGQPVPGSSGLAGLILLKPEDKDASNTAKLGPVNSSQSLQFLWLGDRLLLYPGNCELTAEGIKCVAKSMWPALDLKTGRLVDAQGDGTFGLNGRTFRFDDLTVPANGAGMVVRDKGGRVWRGMVRLDGPTPVNYGPRLREPGRFWQIADAELYNLDTAEGFKCLKPDELGIHLYNVDLATRTGWQTEMRGNERVLQCVEVDKKGQAKTLFEVPSGAGGLDGGVPRFRTPDGSWWADSCSATIRVTPDRKIKRYPVEQAHCAHSVWATEGGEVILSVCRPDKIGSDGWMPMEYYKFGQRKDTFESYPGIWDDFAWKIGKYELSVLPTPPGLGMPYTSVMQRVDGQWQRFRPDFVSGELTPGLGTGDANRPITAAAGSRNGDRILLNIRGLGVCEYDGKNDRWARLVEDTNHCWYFSRSIIDGHGRRIIMGSNFGRDHALVYDGDPFESEAWQRAMPSAQEEADFQSLLKQLDSPKYVDRQNATAEIKKAALKFLPALEKAVADQRFSEEARGRVRQVLEPISPAVRRDAAMPALLGLDCPTPPLATRPAE